MANELTFSASLNFTDSEGENESLVLDEVEMSVSTKKFTKVKHNVGLTEEAMILGEVASLGMCLIINRDATNFVEVRTGTGGTKIVKLMPKKGALFQFGSGITAPFIIADTAACQVVYMICST